MILSRKVLFCILCLPSTNIMSTFYMTINCGLCNNYVISPPYILSIRTYNYLIYLAYLVRVFISIFPNLKTNNLIYFIDNCLSTCLYELIIKLVRKVMKQHFSIYAYDIIYNNNFGVVLHLLNFACMFYFKTIFFHSMLAN